MTSNNETVHVSFGNTANYITSHLLNLQGLAATTTNNNDGAKNNESSLCDPSVTHDITSASSDYYASANSGNISSSRYMHVPRALMIDGRDSFGSSWGSRADDNNYISRKSGAGIMSTESSSSAAWSGKVSIFDASHHNDVLYAGNQQQQRCREESSSRQVIIDPLDNFHNAASVMGLSYEFSRFNAEPPSSYNSGGYYSSNNASNNRHVDWDDFEEQEEEEEDEYCYGQDRQRMQEIRRRQLERKNEELKSGYNDTMTKAWEEAFYGQQPSSSSSELGVSYNNGVDHEATSPSSTDHPHATVDPSSLNNTMASAAVERNIYWHDYFMPPRPHPSKYQVLLPFDTDNNSQLSSNNSANDDNNSNNNAWASSYSSGYSGSGYVSQSWRENVLSEALRKVLEGCDIVKGFNLMIDGGAYSGAVQEEYDNDTASFGGANNSSKYAKQLSQIVAGGAFHGGLAASFLEELQEECRSAGRLAILVDPIFIAANNRSSNTLFNRNEVNRVDTFRRCVNAGLALHGLSSNSDAFLPVSIDGAHRALYGDERSASSSPNRKLFEGSAAVAFALESSTLCYRLRRDKPSSSSTNNNHPNNNQNGRRSRLGIQSGFYQGYSGNSGYEDDANDPFASASSLTYHEFLACARPSSDRRRSILELDALVRPISRPSAAGAGGGGGADIASLLARNGSAVSQELMQLQLAGIIGGGNDSQDHFGELHERMMRGTTIEEMRLEQDRRRSRGRAASSRRKEPGEWMEDMSTNAGGGGGGILSSLSGNDIAFGRRTDHHHFALLTSLRPSAVESRRSKSAAGGGSTCVASAYLRPMMESMGMKYRPEVSSGLVVRDSVAQLTGVSSYWGSIFAERRFPSRTTATGGASAAEGMSPETQQQSERPTLSATDIANNTPILSVLGNSTRSYPRLNSISTGLMDSLHSRSNKGYFSRDVMSGLIPESDDCEEALEYCRELVDVYEPPLGSGLVDGEDSNDDIDAYFDEDS